MNDALQQFGTFLRDQAGASLADLTDKIAQLEPNYARMSRSELHAAIQQSHALIARSIENNDTSELIAYCTELSRQRAMIITLHEALAAMELFRVYILDQLAVFLGDQAVWPVATMRRLVDIVSTFASHFIAGFDDAFQQAQTALRLQAEQLEAQSRTIRELSTPILPVHDGVIVVPLVGFLDGQRATQVMENLLQAIAAYQADMVIIDITGVPVVDTSVVNYLMQTVRAVHLVGAQIVLVGISPEIAQTIVQLGVNLKDIITLANLQQGVQYAFRRVGWSIVR